MSRQTGRTTTGLFVLMAVLLLLASRTVAEDLTLPVGGKVTIELIYSESASENILSIVSPDVRIERNGCISPYVTDYEPELPGAELGSEDTSRRGCQVVLDADPTKEGIQPFAAGTILEFNLCVREDLDPGCDQLWSSNPAHNPDGAREHLHTNPLHPSSFPGRIFELAWEDLPLEGQPPEYGDFNDLIAVVRIDMDSDGDGLWDDWEEFGIDTNGDGIIDFDLPNLLPVDLDGDGDYDGPGERTSPTHKDIFLEIDYMDCTLPGSDCPDDDEHIHLPKEDAITALVQAFRDAPVENLDGSTGITLHVEVSNNIPHIEVLELSAAGFGAIKDDPANFGATNPRRYVFHYALFGHRLFGSSASGAGEVHGNDFCVMFGGKLAFSDQEDFDGDGLSDRHVGTVQDQATTIMHELGHNLGLLHGGDEDLNNKPNYISVMNYLFSNTGIPPTDPDGPADPLTARVDYSRTTLPTLDETSLDEATGIGIEDTTDHTRFYCPNLSRKEVPAAGPIDWNCNGDESGTNLDLDISRDSVCVRPGIPWTLETTPSSDDIVVGYYIVDGPDRTCDTEAASTDEQAREVGSVQQTILTGYNDWENLKFDFQSTGSFQDNIYTDILIEVHQPPVAEAGPNQTVECEVDLAAAILLDGSGSSAVPRDDIVLYEWFQDFGLPSQSLLGLGVSLEISLPLGTHPITLQVTDSVGAKDIDEVLVTVEDTTAPVVTCNAPPTITPVDAPNLFTATASDNCDSDPIVEITGFECFEIKKKDKVVDKRESCQVSIEGDTITIIDAGGVNDHIAWQVIAADSSGNQATSECELLVVHPRKQNNSSSFHSFSNKESLQPSPYVWLEHTRSRHKTDPGSETLPLTNFDRDVELEGNCPNCLFPAHQ